MPIAEKVGELRKKLGIKKLRKKIPVSEFEKAVIVSLRENEKHRIAQKARLRA